MPYRKICRNCQKEFVSDDYATVAARVHCDACFEALPDYVEEFGMPEPAPAAPVQPVANSDFGFGPGPTTQSNDAEAALDSLFGFPSAPAQAPARQQSANASGFGAPAPQPAVRPTIDVPPVVYPNFELRWTGTNRVSTLPVVLPDALSGGYVGRDGQLCDAEVDRPTISRIQFAYKYAPDGNGIEITNLSQFGTWVNGRLLQRNDSTVAPAGSTIEMGGFQFELAVEGSR